MSDIWFTSDWHLGHHRICELADRPFDSVPEMNEALITNFNELVAPGDVVFVLGDVAMGTIADSLPLVGQMHGHKRLIYGNHDRMFHAKDAKLDRWMNAYGEFFVEIRQRDMIWLGNKYIWMNHFPHTGDSQDEERFLEDRPPVTEDWLMHGHIHDKVFADVDNKQIHVGVDSEVANYGPIHADQIVEIVTTN